MAGSVKGDGTEEFKGLRITSLDDDRDEEEEQKEPDVAMDDDDEEEEDEEARNSVILGFVKKTKKSRSLLRHFFHSKAGGVPKTCRPEDLAAATYAVNLCNLCFRNGKLEYDDHFSNREGNQRMKPDKRCKRESKVEAITAKDMLSTEA